MIDTKQLYVKVLPVSTGETYGNEVKIVAATDSFVVFSHTSPYLPKNEEVLSRTQFEKNYITTEEKSRRVKSAFDKAMRKLDAVYGLAEAKLGQPVEIGYNQYQASNGVVIRFDEMGHVNFPPCDTKNPLSSYDVPWVAAKSKALREAWDRRERVSSRYGYSRW